MRVVNKFSWHESPGDFAERYFLRHYFRNVGLRFRKIRKDKQGKKPDGYIKDASGKRIAVAEVKLITYHHRSPGIQRITLDTTVKRHIHTAKKQLRTETSELPKIIYLIGDDSFFKPVIFRSALFGKWNTVVRGGVGQVFNGHSGFFSKSKTDDKFHDGLISAVICYIPTMRDYTLWIYRNRDSLHLPKILLDRKHIGELWDYDSRKLRQII